MAMSLSATADSRASRSSSGGFQSLSEFLPLVYDDALDTRQPHAGQCIDIITDQKHFHTVNPAGR